MAKYSKLLIVNIADVGTLNHLNKFKKVHTDSLVRDLVLPNNKRNSNTKTKTQDVGTETKKAPSPNSDTVRAKQGLALSKFKFGKKRGPRLISITVIRVPRYPLTPHSRCPSPGRPNYR